MMEKVFLNKKIKNKAAKLTEKLPQSRTKHGIILSKWNEKIPWSLRAKKMSYFQFPESMGEPNNMSRSLLFLLLDWKYIKYFCAN